MSVLLETAMMPLLDRLYIKMCAKERPDVIITNKTE